MVGAVRGCLRINLEALSNGLAPEPLKIVAVLLLESVEGDPSVSQECLEGILQDPAAKEPQRPVDVFGTRPEHSHASGQLNCRAEEGKGLAGNALRTAHHSH
jgi:hypothetical protein